MEEIMEEDTEEGVLIPPAIIGAPIMLEVPLYEGLLSNDVARAFAPLLLLFNCSIDEKVGLKVLAGAAAVGGLGAKTPALPLPIPLPNFD